MFGSFLHYCPLELCIGYWWSCMARQLEHGFYFHSDFFRERNLQIWCVTRNLPLSFFLTSQFPFNFSLNSRQHVSKDECTKIAGPIIATNKILHTNHTQGLLTHSLGTKVVQRGKFIILYYDCWVMGMIVGVWLPPLILAAYIILLSYCSSEHDWRM